MAALLSALSVALCVLVGLVLHLAPVRRLWQRSARPAAVLLVVGLVLFGLGLLLHHPAEAYPLDTDPDEQHNVLWPSTFPGLLLFLFAVLHWPTPPRTAHARVA